jgi:hypothetical protein
MNNNIIVQNYLLYLDLDLDNYFYKGIVEIDIEVIKKINKIQINSKDIQIKSLNINKDKNDNNNKNECVYIEDNENECINIEGFFIPDKYKIIINFENKITDETDGFYWTKKYNKIICCTHFEPQSARKFMPCFDQPDMKSTFNVIVKVSSKYECVSNSSVKEIHYNDDDTKIIFYNSTPKMSTYLLCIVVGNIKPVLETPLISKNGTKINGYSVSEDSEYLKWSIKHTLKSVDFFENWFGIKYSLDKLDIVSIPNFSSGAMENWGLITFREEFILLFNNSNNLSKIKILEVIYHEVAHQWFGNLVTISKWKDLWLNESTATFFSWMALQMIYKKYQSAEFYWLLECRGLFNTDGYTNTHAIVMESLDSIDPTELFDEITYSKGNLLINYISNLVGIDNFQKSINKYIISNLYSNTDSNEFYKFINLYSKNSSININFYEYIDKLTKIKGYPILFVNKQNNKFYIDYKTFNLNPKKLTTYDLNLWLSITYYDTNKDINLKKTILLDKNKKTCLADNIFPNSNIENNFIINQNNELFCICMYIGYEPNIFLMNQVELMKYIHDQFILCIQGFLELSFYFELIRKIFISIDLIKNYLLLLTILNDIEKILQIINSIHLKMNKTKKMEIINTIKKIISKKLDDYVQKLIYSDCKYLELILDEIFIILAIHFENKKIINLLYNIYLSENKTSLENNSFNNYIFSKSIFRIILKYYQNKEIHNLLNLYKNYENIQIRNSIIESFEFLNNTNFDKIFLNFKNIIKSQDYKLFFSSISKNVSNQTYIVDYWIKNSKTISKSDEIRYSILKSICINIFSNDLIDLVKKYINQHNLEQYHLIQVKIIDILENNFLIAKLLI